MRASEKGPEPEVVPDEPKPEEPRRPLWSFANLGRKVRLGPNRSMLGED